MTAAASVRSRFEALRASGPILLSGGFGTELRRRGTPTPLPLWAAAALRDDPDTVRRLHTNYVRAGARIVTANTFRTNRRALAKAGLAHEARTLTALAVRLASEGVAQAEPSEPVLVAASIAPLEDCYRPQDVPDELTLRAEHGLRVGDAVAAGAPLGFVETMNTVREACAALGAARAAGLPAAVSFVCGPRGALLSGESIEEAAEAVASFDPLAILVNCCAPATATEALTRLRSATRFPVGVYANGRGCSDDEHGWRFEGGVGDLEYLRHARDWLGIGASLIGGCCGTTPRTIRKLAELLR